MSTRKTVPPGHWLYALFIVFMIYSWVPSLFRFLGMKKAAKNLKGGCLKCNSRMKMMDAAGWLGLPRLMIRKEFWCKQHKVGWIWSRNQTVIISSP